MKQGSGKVEPRPHAISVDKVANIGLQIVRTHPASKSLYSGKGFMAPPLRSMKSSNSGSQGTR